jgi:Flp pilus assembly protein TadG
VAPVSLRWFRSPGIVRFRPLPLQRLARNEHGASAAEFAISASVMFTMLIGIMKICLAIYTYHYVSEVAREGSRYAMVRGSSCSGFPSACPATSDNVQNYVRSLHYPGITPSLLTVTTSWATYPVGKPCTPSATCNNPSDLVTVNASYAFPLNIPGMASKTYTMSSTSKMVIAR